MSKLNVILAGGCGINCGVAIKKDSKTTVLKEATFIGLDASTANDSDGLFPIEHMTAIGSEELARGSGKKKITNYEQAEDFVTKVMSKHKPGDVNIIIGSTAGGSGSMLTTVIIRYLAKRGIPFVCCFVSDFTSIVEMENSIGTLRSTAVQTNPKILGAAIPFLHFINDEDSTRREVNDRIVDKINILSLFLTESNEEADYEDVKNLLTYNKHYDVPPALSMIEFYDETKAEVYRGKPPVGVFSLYDDKDSIIPRFSGSVIRTTGVFPTDAVKPGNVQELHMTLNHGDFLGELEIKMEELKEAKVKTSNIFREQHIEAEDANEDGIFL